MEVLFSRPQYGSGIGLHRMCWLADRLPKRDWLGSLDAIHITGSNGKGSTALILANILGELGVRCGRYTSPHLSDFRERIAVGSELIAPGDLARSCGWLERALDEWSQRFPNDEISSFEAATAVALHHFDEVRPETVVCEAGIGGRHDPTRIVPGAVSVLTAVELEHTAVLGDREELIAYDKADLAPRGGLLIAGPLAPDLRRRLAGYTRVGGITLEDTPAVTSVSPKGDGLRFSLEHGHLTLDDLHLPAIGAYHAVNAACAIAAALAWCGVHRPKIADAELEGAIRSGLGRSVLPGRLERIDSSPPTYIDIGHTPGATSQVAATIAAFSDRALLLVTGASEDRPVETILAPLVNVADEVICTRARHRGATVERVAAAVRHGGREPLASAETVEQAMSLAREHAVAKGQAILVAGGLFLAMEAEAIVRGRDPRSLRYC